VVLVPALAVALPLALRPTPAVVPSKAEVRAEPVRAPRRIILFGVDGLSLDILRDGPPRVTADLAREAGVSSGVVKSLADIGAIVAVSLPRPSPFEMPDAERFFAEAGAVMKQGSRLLLAEPRFEVPEQKFADTLRVAGRYGLRMEHRLSIRWTRAAVLVKDQ